MSEEAKKKQSNELVKASDSNLNKSFNFELWAREVKRQMIAALQKRDLNKNKH